MPHFSSVQADPGHSQYFQILETSCGNETSNLPIVLFFWVTSALNPFVLWTEHFPLLTSCIIECVLREAEG